MPCSPPVITTTLSSNSLLIQSFPVKNYSFHVKYTNQSFFPLSAPSGQSSHCCHRRRHLFCNFCLLHTCSVKFLRIRYIRIIIHLNIFHGICLFLFFTFLAKPTDRNLSRCFSSSIVPISAGISFKPSYFPEAAF